MKRIPLILYCNFIIPYLLQAQPMAVVSDPGSYARMAEQMVSMKQQLDVLIETKEQLSKTKETIADIRKATTVVKDVVRQLSLIDRVINNQRLVFQQTQKTYEYLKNSKQFSSRELKVIFGNLSNVLRRSEESLSVANSVLKEGFFEMNDKERITLLEDMNNSIKEMNADIRTMDRAYRRTAQMRILNKVFIDGNND